VSRAQRGFCADVLARIESRARTLRAIDGCEPERRRACGRRGSLRL